MLFRSPRVASSDESPSTAFQGGAAGEWSDGVCTERAATASRRSASAPRNQAVHDARKHQAAARERKRGAYPMSRMYSRVACAAGREVGRLACVLQLSVAVSIGFCARTRDAFAHARVRCWLLGCLPASTVRTLHFPRFQGRLQRHLLTVCYSQHFYSVSL